MIRNALRSPAAGLLRRLRPQDRLELLDALRALAEEALSGDPDEEVAIQLGAGLAFIDEARNIRLSRSGDAPAIVLDPRELEAVLESLSSHAASVS